MPGGEILLGPPVVPFYPFFREKKRHPYSNIFLTSLLEDLDREPGPRNFALGPLPDASARGPSPLGAVLRPCCGGRGEGPEAREAAEPQAAVFFEKGGMFFFGGDGMMDT